MMSRTTVEALRLANRDLCAGLARLQSSRNPSAALRSEDFSTLRTDLLRAANCIRTISPDSAPDAELEKEISEYRSNLEQLAKILPSVHGRLQAHKGRLDTALDHLRAAEVWAETTKNSL